MVVLEEMQGESKSEEKQVQTKSLGPKRLARATGKPFLRSTTCGGTQQTSSCSVLVSAQGKRSVDAVASLGHRLALLAYVHEAQCVHGCPADLVTRKSTWTPCSPFLAIASH